MLLSGLYDFPEEVEEPGVTVSFPLTGVIDEEFAFEFHLWLLENFGSGLDRLGRRTRGMKSVGA